jgi:hypothetical protein
MSISIKRKPQGNHLRLPFYDLYTPLLKNIFGKGEKGGMGE